MQTLAQVVKVTPGHSALVINATFNAFAAGLLTFVEKGAIQSFSLLPNGVGMNREPGPGTMQSYMVSGCMCAY